MHNEPHTNGGDGELIPLSRIHILSYQSALIRFTMIDSQPWFIATDVCKAIGAYNPRQGAAHYVRAVSDDSKALRRLQTQVKGVSAVLTVSRDGLDKLLWLALHSVTKAWSVLSSVDAQVSVVVSRGASDV
ncbi:hypothetical protein EFR00_30475 [Rhizobium sophoriradicis]|uniref:hypothetical protein n=1 Tax=Rhizobium sophoriradicis TaxID=1535245 RepID=UPI00098ED0D5|nr:hypothetical protein [Rhizobium sophoriradicis]RSB82474.1 hypothetical protein EFR00_30475 [Rhizobium sophoriradicis]